ncbi:helix-turn-helix domain-containing protein [Fibrella forsythiae]|uniref:Helix-turn-helix domain-containing protein n=1 Tax=Fibrella forsythiae TaxID=2817061 RepID=A0ABS3JKT5_9BACT|nr:helix-turn-helix domain-containing protein [Fibrella forsythiae]MBO0949829.1 helix-turn-helix domain-containing protein [Fibrella forsythiae]
MKRIIQFDGLYGEADTDLPNRRPNGDYLFSERIETRSRTFDWVIQPHTHARLFQVFFLETGGVEFSEATQKRQLSGPVVLLIPFMALHGFVYTPDTTGRILTLSDTLIDALFPNTSALTTMLGSIQCIQAFDEPYSAQAIEHLMGQLNEELIGDQPEKQTMLHLGLQQLFIVFYRLWSRQNESVQTSANSIAIRHFRQFQQRVRQVGTTHSIVQLADELAITPVHLNRICQAIAGKSASQLVQEYVLSEACKYLIYTGYSVSEIAYLLHFEYPNYFARFFRKHTGLSPTEFREKQPAP